MDELKQQFYEVMHKYQKPFSEEGVTANLTQWYEQKQGLLQLLRRHPLWNEKELAIVFRVEERREIDRATVDETRAAILELGRRACTDDTVYENFETALRASTADYCQISLSITVLSQKQKGAASGVRSEHLMQPKVRPLFGGHAGCGLILGSLLSANGRKYLYKKVPAGETPRPIQRNAIYYRHRLQKQQRMLI